MESEFSSMVIHDPLASMVIAISPHERPLILNGDVTIRSESPMAITDIDIWHQLFHYKQGDLLVTMANDNIDENLA